MSLVRRADPRSRERWLAVGLFGATCASVAFSHLIWWRAPGASAGRAVADAVLFTAVLMGVLLAHELGHGMAARRRGFHLSTPYFLPFPLVVGTLGALIGIRDRPPDRRALVEMALAGPLAGLLAIALATAAWASWGVPSVEGLELSRPLGMRAAAAVVGGELPRVSTADPVLFAAWIGCLVTALNLVPLGQLDGGHVLRGAFPAWGAWTDRVVVGALLAAGLWWTGWAVWAVLVWFAVRREPVAVRRGEPPAPPILPVVACAVFALCVTLRPVPPDQLASGVGPRLLAGCDGAFSR